MEARYPVNDRIKKAIGESPLSITEVAERIEIPYSTLRGYLRQDWPAKLDTVIAIATVLQVSPEWLLTGRGSMLPDRTLVETLGASTDEEQRRIDEVWQAIRESLNPTPTEEQVFRSYVARWLLSDPLPTVEERLVRVAELAEMVQQPLVKFGTNLDARRRTDYIVGILHALGLAMPERKR